jgi:isobutyryl-CoA mutase
MGLEGMVADLLQRADFPLGIELPKDAKEKILQRDYLTISQTLSWIENHPDKAKMFLDDFKEQLASSNIPIVGITGN